MYPFYYLLLPQQNALIHSFMISEECITIYRNDNCSQAEFERLMQLCQKVRFISDESSDHKTIPSHDDTKPHCHLWYGRNLKKLLVPVGTVELVLATIISYQSSDERKKWLRSHSKPLVLKNNDFSAQKLESFLGVISTQYMQNEGQKDFLSEESAKHLLETYKECLISNKDKPHATGCRSNFSLFNSINREAKPIQLSDDENDMQLNEKADLRKHIKLEVKQNKANDKEDMQLSEMMDLYKRISLSKPSIPIKKNIKSNSENSETIKGHIRRCSM